MNRRTFFKVMAWAIAQIGMPKIAGPMSEPWFAGCDACCGPDCTVISFWASDGTVFRSIDGGETFVEQYDQDGGWYIMPIVELGDKWTDYCDS